MKNGIWSGIRLYIFCYIMLIVAAVPMQVSASEPAVDINIHNDVESPPPTDEKPPHLIQTVTEQDIYEGMLKLGLLECKVLETPDCDMAYENVRDCVVSVNMGKAYGSGVIWEMTPTQIVIVTNKHVLEYWSEYESYIHFPQGYYIDAGILGISEEHDVGFLTVDNTKFDYSELENLRYVRKDKDVYNAMKSGDEIFCLGTETDSQSNNITVSHTAEDASNYYKGSIGEMERYIDEFGEYMIYGLGYAKPGMSGGGTFDASGNFIGMISGGTSNGETASIPLPVINEEYRKIRRNVR